MARIAHRRLLVAVIAVALAVTCVSLGAWQLRRLDERRAVNASIVRQRGAPAVRIERARADADLVLFRPVIAVGTYDTGREVLVYGRSLEGRSGHHVVTPLLLEDGSAVLIVRGWVPFEMQTAPVPPAAPTAKAVTVRGFLVPDEGDGSGVPDASGVVRRLDVAGIASTLPYPIAPRPVQLTQQAPPQRSGLPVSVPPPELSEGPHLSYAIQWFSFAAIALLGGAILIRRDRRPATADP